MIGRALVILQNDTNRLPHAPRADGLPGMLFPKVLSDTRWADRRISTPWMIGLVTFGILTLELATIRWTSSQVRIFAYFNNVVLIGAFFGMGVGVGVGVGVGAAVGVPVGVGSGVWYL